MYPGLVRVCVLLSICSISSVLSCRWIKHKFHQHHGASLGLIGKMGEKIEDHENINPIPYELIENHRSADVNKHDQILFVIQALIEITGVFEDAVSAPWSVKKIEDFINVIYEEIDGLRSCGTFKMKRNKKLHLYFQRLRNMIKPNMENVGKNWEIIRKRVISFLNQLDQFFPVNTHV